MEMHLELSNAKTEEIKEVTLPSRRNLSIKEWKNKHKAKINASERKRKERVSNSINLLREVLDNSSDLTSKESVIKAATKCIVSLREKIDMMLKCGTNSNMELELKSLQEKNKLLEKEKEYYMKILKSYSISTAIDNNLLSTKAKKVKISPSKKKHPPVQLSSPASEETSNFCSSTELCSSESSNFHHMNEFEKRQNTSQITSQMESVYNSKPFPTKYCSMTWSQAKIKESDKNLNDVTSVLSNTENQLEATSHNITSISDDQIKRGKLSASHISLETYDVNNQNKSTNTPTQFYCEPLEPSPTFQSKLKRVTKSSSFTIDDLIQNPLTTKPHSSQQPQYETYIPATPTFTSGNYYHEKDVEATSFYQSTNKQPPYENQFSCRTLYHPQTPKPNHNTITTLWQPAINNVPKSTNANMSHHGTTPAPIIEKNYEVTAGSHQRNSRVNCSFSSTSAYNHVTNQSTFIPNHYMQQTHIEPSDTITDGNISNSHDYNQRSQSFTDHHNVWLAKKSKGPTSNQLNGSNSANSIWQLIDC